MKTLHSNPSKIINVTPLSLTFCTYHQKKISFITQRGIEGPPDLIVEILSPFNSRTDMVTKKNTDLEFGVNEYWIVDPFQKNITVYTQSSGQNVPSHVFTGKDKVSSPQVFPH